MGGTSDRPGLTLAYDPTGRLRSTVNNTGAGTWFLYAGDQLIGEYAGAAVGEPPLRRYVHGPGVDEPLVWYEGAGVAQPIWLHPDRQGSIIATSDEAGLVTTYAYGPWGETDTWGGPRFRYTGQASLPEIQAYHYKARVYEPTLGRFLQTDPIGQADDPNLYAYVKGDPTNHGDPSGNCAEDACVVEGTLVAATLGTLIVTDALTHQCGASCVNTAVDQVKGIIGGIIHHNDEAKPADGKADKPAGPTAAAERDKNRANGIPDSKLGPSGKPKVHDVDHSSRKGAKDAAGRDTPKGGKVRNDTSPANDKQGPHFQGENPDGTNVKPVVHHNYPD